MNLQTVKNNMNRGRLSFEEMNYLVKTIEFLEEENCNMALKHAEKDVAIRELMQMNIQQKERIAQLEAIKEMYLNSNLVLLDQNDRLMAQAKEMKRNSRLTRFFEIAEENLRLVEENERMKKEQLRNRFIEQTIEENKESLRKLADS